MTQTCLKPAYVDRMLNKTLGDEELFTRLMGYLNMLPKDTVTLKASFDDVVLLIRGRAMKQLKGCRSVDAE